MPAKGKGSRVLNHPFLSKISHLEEYINKIVIENHWKIEEGQLENDHYPGRIYKRNQ